VSVAAPGEVHLLSREDLKLIAFAADDAQPALPGEQ